MHSRWDRRFLETSVSLAEVEVEAEVEVRDHRVARPVLSLGNPQSRVHARAPTSPLPLIIYLTFCQGLVLGNTQFSGTLDPSNCGLHRNRNVGFFMLPRMGLTSEAP
jgi:hypothetical protein